MEQPPTIPFAAAESTAVDRVALATRVRGEYVEMPGLHLTVRQAARLFGVTPDIAQAVLDDLCRTAVLARSEGGTYLLSR